MCAYLFEKVLFDGFEEIPRLAEMVLCDGGGRGRTRSDRRAGVNAGVGLLIDGGGRPNALLAESTSDRSFWKNTRTLFSRSAAVLGRPRRIGPP